MSLKMLPSIFDMPSITLETPLSLSVAVLSTQSPGVPRTTILRAAARASPEDEQQGALIGLLTYWIIFS